MKTKGSQRKNNHPGKWGIVGNEERREETMRREEARMWMGGREEEAGWRGQVSV